MATDSQPVSASANSRLKHGRPRYRHYRHYRSLSEWSKCATEYTSGVADIVEDVIRRASSVGVGESRRKGAEPRAAARVIVGSLLFVRAGQPSCALHIQLKGSKDRIHVRPQGRQLHDGLFFEQVL